VLSGDRREPLTFSICSLYAACNASTARNCWQAGVNVRKCHCVNCLDGIGVGSNTSISYGIWLSHSGCIDRWSLTACCTYILHHVMMPKNRRSTSTDSSTFISLALWCCWLGNRMSNWPTKNLTPASTKVFLWKTLGDQA